tara:strand:- start:195 stop:1214 length:1020 start_codon:yes stop_codon:yes gene_type:complete
MESYGLSETLNQQESLTQQDKADNEAYQNQINFNYGQFTDTQTNLADAQNSLEEKVQGGLGGEVLDMGVKVKGLMKAREAGYVGTYDNLAKQGAAVKTFFKGTPAMSNSERLAAVAGKDTGEGEVWSGGGEATAGGAEATTTAGGAEATETANAGGTGEVVAGAGEGAADTAGSTASSVVVPAATEAAEGGAEVAGGAASTTLKVVGEVGGRVFGGAMGAAQLGLDIYKQVEGGGFMKGGVNTGDDIGNVTNELGSVIDIAGAATGDPLLMLAGVGVGLIGSGISEISELFHHKKKVAPPVKATQEGYAPVAVQSLAAEGAVGSTQGGSSLQAVQAGAS